MGKSHLNVTPILENFLLQFYRDSNTFPPHHLQFYHIYSFIQDLLHLREDQLLPGTARGASQAWSLVRRGGALTTRGSSRQGGHHQGAQRQAPPQGLRHGMLWHLAAEDGREGDMDHPQGQVFQIF